MTFFTFSILLTPAPHLPIRTTLGCEQFHFLPGFYWHNNSSSSLACFSCSGGFRLMNQPVILTSNFLPLSVRKRLSFLKPSAACLLSTLALFLYLSFMLICPPPSFPYHWTLDKPLFAFTKTLLHLIHFINDLKF